jgi:AmmeMemoRadiSam system protein B
MKKIKKMVRNSYRLPAVEGTFYNSNPVKLTQQLDAFFSKAPDITITGKILGIVAPHAGYIYSGFTAAVAYNLLKESEIKNVIIISPSHREYFKAVTIFPGLGYSTLFGNIDINQDIKEELLKYDLIKESTMGHGAEHALEIQLPLLQRVLKSNFNILPLVMGDQSKQICLMLGEILFKVLENKNDYLIVASSDLSHFYSSTEAKVKDDVMINGINNFDVDGMLKNLESKKVEACGAGPIVAMMMATKKLGAGSSKVLHYSNSGDVTGDNSEVVGYLSAIVWKQ